MLTRYNARKSVPGPLCRVAHPQSNGIIERYHRSTRAALRDAWPAHYLATLASLPPGSTTTMNAACTPACVILSLPSTFVAIPNAARLNGGQNSNGADCTAGKLTWPGRATASDHYTSQSVPQSKPRLWITRVARPGGLHIQNEPLVLLHVKRYTK